MLWKLIFANWKTTVVGVGEGIGQLVISQVLTGHVSWPFILMGSLQLVKGALSKDANVTGGTTPNAGSKITAAGTTQTPGAGPATGPSA